VLLGASFNQCKINEYADVRDVYARDRDLCLAGAIVLVATVGITGCSNSRPTESKSENTNKPVVISLEGGDWGYPTPLPSRKM